MHSSPSVAVLAAPDAQAAPRIARLLGVEAVEPGGVLQLRGAQVVHAFVAPAFLPWLVLGLAGFRSPALVVTLLGPPTALGPWARPVARFLFPSQRLARQWNAFLPLGRLVVVEPCPDGGGEGGVYVAGEAEADDPTRIVAAARAGAAVVSSVAHDGLPPGAVVRTDTEAARLELLADGVRRTTLGRLAAGWAARGRTPDVELGALRAVYAEVASMGGRGGR